MTNGNPKLGNNLRQSLGKLCGVKKHSENGIRRCERHGNNKDREERRVAVKIRNRRSGSETWKGPAVIT